jgi:hypothetical protein
MTGLKRNRGEQVAYWSVVVVYGRSTCVPRVAPPDQRYVMLLRALSLRYELELEDQDNYIGISTRIAYRLLSC